MVGGSWPRRARVRRLLAGGELGPADIIGPAFFASGLGSDGEVVDEHYAGEGSLQELAVEILHHGAVFVADTSAGADFHLFDGDPFLAFGAGDFEVGEFVGVDDIKHRAFVGQFAGTWRLLGEQHVAGLGGARVPGRGRGKGGQGDQGRQHQGLAGDGEGGWLSHGEILSVIGKTAFYHALCCAERPTEGWHGDVAHLIIGWQ